MLSYIESSGRWSVGMLMGEGVQLSRFKPYLTLDPTAPTVTSYLISKIIAACMCNVFHRQTMALKEENLEPYETPSAPKPPAEPEVVEVRIHQNVQVQCSLL